MAKKSAVRSKKRILIVDDHPMIRQGLSQLIGITSDLTVCGEAETAEIALDRINTLKPDLVLTDISLPGKNGLELIKESHAIHPSLPILAISAHDESLYAERVLQAGGRGYVMKQEGGEIMMHAIRKVLGGQIYLSGKMSALILEIFSGRRDGADRSPVDTLTDREFEVFQLVGEGKVVGAIADKLGVRTRTVKTHKTKIKKKLKLKSTAELIRFVVRWTGLQDPSPKRARIRSVPE